MRQTHIFASINGAVVNMVVLAALFDESLCMFAAYDRRLGQMDESIKVIGRALDHYRNAQTVENKKLVEAHEELARTYLGYGDFDKMM